MAKIINNKRAINSVYLDEEVIADELGAETEAEKHMKEILKNQLKTTISINEQFSKHRTFISPSTLHSLTELVHGTCSLEKFREIEKDEEVRQELQRCGLTNQEIIDYLHFKSQKDVEKNRIVNPEIQRNVIHEIEKKIKTHKEELLKPQEFKNVKKLTRHEMDIENTLYNGCSEKNKLSSLVTAATGMESDAYNYIKTLSHTLTQKWSKRKKNLKNEKGSEKAEASNSTTSLVYDPNIHHVIVPLVDDEVSEKRLTVEEIKKLPRFEEYHCGKPNKILYLKNLHPKCTVDELRAVFGQFDEVSNQPIDYRLCTGRMKGQAFVTFPSVEVSEKALQFANGYILRGKPIIIAYGKKS